LPKPFHGFVYSGTASSFPPIFFELCPPPVPPPPLLSLKSVIRGLRLRAVASPRFVLRCKPDIRLSLFTFCCERPRDPSLSYPVPFSPFVFFPDSRHKGMGPLFLFPSRWEIGWFLMFDLIVTRFFHFPFFRLVRRVFDFSFSLRPDSSRLFPLRLVCLLFCFLFFLASFPLKGQPRRRPFLTLGFFFATSPAKNRIFSPPIHRFPSADAPFFFFFPSQLAFCVYPTDARFLSPFFPRVIFRLVPVTQFSAVPPPRIRFLFRLFTFFLLGPPLSS